MNVLSLFDGMSCGQIALNRLGIKYDNYFASEIDKYAMKVTEANYPNTRQMGSVEFINGVNLPKIDLLFGGSPCQGFSFAGKRLNFSDPRSKLFFEFVRILKETKPKYFLLENVKMKKESQNIITEYLGVEPIEINSNLVSAQNRRRLYWTNIPGVQQPKDKEIYLKDIIEEGVLSFSQKSQTLLATIYKENAKSMVKRNKKGLLVGPELTDFGQYKGPKLMIREKSKCVRSSGRGSYDRHEWDSVDKLHYRKLTPTECERLQTVPDNYTNHVSNTQRYKMLGNGWTVDVIAHIFKNM